MPEWAIDRYPVLAIGDEIYMNVYAAVYTNDDFVDFAVPDQLIVVMQPVGGSNAENE